MLVENPLVKVPKVAVLILEDAPYDVDDSEVLTHWYVYVFGVQIAGQDEAADTILHEVDACDLFLLKVYMLVFEKQHWLDQRAYPTDEEAGPRFEEDYGPVSVFVNV